ASHRPGRRASSGGKRSCPRPSGRPAGSAHSAFPGSHLGRERAFPLPWARRASPPVLSPLHIGRQERRPRPHRSLPPSRPEVVIHAGAGQGWGGQQPHLLPTGRRGTQVVGDRPRGSSCGAASSASQAGKLREGACEAAPASLPVAPGWRTRSAARPRTVRPPAARSPEPARDFTLVETVLCLVIFICYSASRVAGYLSVPVVEMVLAAVFFAIFMFNVHHQLQFINWPWTDFFRALLFLSSSSSPHSSPSSETRMLRAQWEG
uniref:MARVEL domain-containing protein n=1 Tax=Sarcophilus harrisii TaxID=9305 RepID=A0A7N4P3H6_SARHA